MSKEGAVLAARILTELKEIEPLVDNVQEVIANSEKVLSAFAKFLQSG
jgi:hypothetical protein